MSPKQEDGDMQKSRGVVLGRNPGHADAHGVSSTSRLSCASWVYYAGWASLRWLGILHQLDLRIYKDCSSDEGTDIYAMMSCG